VRLSSNVVLSNLNDRQRADEGLSHRELDPVWKYDGRLIVFVATRPDTPYPPRARWVTA